MSVAVRYHLAWGLVFGALAAGNLALWLTSGNLMFVALAVMMGAMGALYATRPLLVVTDTAIQVRSLFGGTRRSFPLDDLGAVEVERDGLVIGRGDAARKLRVSAMFVRSSDMNRLAQAVRQARAAARRPD